MKFYEVRSGKFILGYYRDHENAKSKIKELNDWIKEYRHMPNLDSTPYTIKTILTMD